MYHLRNNTYAQTFLGLHFVLLQNLERYFKKTNTEHWCTFYRLQSYIYVISNFQTSFCRRLGALKHFNFHLFSTLSDNSGHFITVWRWTPPNKNPDKNWSDINSSLIIMSFWRSKLNEEIIKKAKDGYVNACSFPVITDSKKMALSTQLHELGKKRQFSKLFSISPPASLTSFPLRYVSKRKAHKYLSYKG